MAFLRYGRLAACLIGIMMLSACAHQSRYAFEKIAASYQEPYYLDSGDRLRITVFGQNDLSRTYPIDGGGAVAMPLIGSVSARGLTTPELERNIAGRLGARYLRNPDVRVEVETHRPFFILGEVQEAGQYPYVAGMSVETAVAIAGGFTYRADLTQAQITRRTQSDVVKATVLPDTPILPGDTITIFERYF